MKNIKVVDVVEGGCVLGTEKKVVYNGQWDAYKRQYENMNIYSKIQYDYDLKSLIRRINTSKLSFFCSITFTAIMMFLFYILNIDIFDGDRTIMSVAAIFALTFLSIKILDIIIIRKIRKEKMSSTALLILSIAMTFIGVFTPKISETDITWFMVVFGVASFVLFEIYRELSYKGSVELEANIKKELDELAWSIKDDIYNRDFESITPKCKIPLVEDEIVYIEEPAVVVNVIAKTPNAPQIGSSIFKRILSMDVKNSYSFFNEARDVWEKTSCDISKNKMQQKKNQHLKNMLENKLGTILVTNKRVIFVGGDNGFQIRIPNIVDFGSNSDIKNPILTIESTNGIREMRTEGSVWIAMFIDKVKRERQMA